MRIDDMNFGDVVEHLQEWIDELEVEVLRRKQDIGRWHRRAERARVNGFFGARARSLDHERTSRTKAAETEALILRVAGALTVLTEAGKSHE